MKTLLLLRHAKSDWSNPALSDFDRPLNKRGRKAAPAMGQELLRRGWVPDLVYCSAAKRAQETWEAVTEVLGDEAMTIETKILRGLYLASPAQIMNQLHRAPESTKRVMLIAHNPGMEHFAQRLVGAESKDAATARLAEKFPTAALAVFKCPIESWRDLAWHGGRLTHCLWPRELPAS